MMEYYTQPKIWMIRTDPCTIEWEQQHDAAPINEQPHVTVYTLHLPFLLSFLLYQVSSSLCHPSSFTVSIISKELIRKIFQNPQRKAEFSQHGYIRVLYDAVYWELVKIPRCNNSGSACVSLRLTSGSVLTWFSAPDWLLPRLTVADCSCDYVRSHGSSDYHGTDT